MSEKRTAVRHETVLTYELDDDELPSEVVIAAVAAVSNTTPAAMEPLAKYVDPDALDGLFAERYDGTTRETGSVGFSFAGYEVVVNDGRVSVLDSGT